MKKYLFLGSLLFALFATAHVYATVCQTTATCATMNYTLTATDVAALGTQYSCTACPLDGTKWSCASRKPTCPAGSSTSYASVCETIIPHSEQRFDGYSAVWVFIEPGKACDNTTFRTQFSAGTSSQCQTAWGYKETVLSKQYRCKMGELEGQNCLSSSTFIYFNNADGTSTPEPCSYLFGAVPDPSCN